MSEQPMAGTFRLDGMLQGTMPPGREEALRKWLATARSSGLHFHLRIEGNWYSLVADPAIRRTSELRGADLEQRLTAQLRELLGELAENGAPHPFSTIRSEEFRHSAVVQTLYSVAPNGEIVSEQRLTEIETRAAPPEITPASLRKAAIPGLVAGLAVLLISMVFIDYRSLFGKARERLSPLTMSELVLHQAPPTELLRYELLKIDRERKSLVFRVSRGSGWDGALATTPAAAVNLDWPEFRTLLALQQGRFRVDFLTKTQQLIRSQEIDLSSLHQQESIEIRLPADSNERIAIVILKP